MVQRQWQHISSPQHYHDNQAKSDDIAIEMEHMDSRPRIHRWIAWTNAIFVTLHLLVVFAVLFTPLLVSKAAPVILTSGLLCLHGLLAGILAMHQISINLSFDAIDYHVPDVLLVAPSNLIVSVNVVCFVFNALHILSLVSVALGVCPSGIEAATCTASRNTAIVAITLSSLAAAVNIGGLITYARVCCVNEHHLPGIMHMISRIPTGEPDSLKHDTDAQQPHLYTQSSTTPAATPSLHNHMFRTTKTRNNRRSLANR